MKTVPTEEYLTNISELLAEGKQAVIPISGASMEPFLAPNRDRVLLAKPDRPLQVGDIALYRRENGRYVLHRVCRVRTDGFYFVGDAQTEPEGPVPADRVSGIVIKACRKEKWIGPGDFLWDCFSCLWARVPALHRPVVKLYTGLK